MFYEMIKDQIKDTRLPLMQIELDQSLFNKELYQFKDQHFWHGSLLKLDSMPYCLMLKQEMICAF